VVGFIRRGRSSLRQRPANPCVHCCKGARRGRAPAAAYIATRRAGRVSRGILSQTGLLRFFVLPAGVFGYDGMGNSGAGKGGQRGLFTKELFWFLRAPRAKTRRKSVAKPRVGLLLGDPTGIGPELVARLLAGFPVHEHADLVVIGDRRYFAVGQQIAGVAVAARIVDRLEEVRFGAGEAQLLDFPGVSPDDVTLGQLSAAAGKSVLEVLAYTLDLARDAKIDAIVFAPFNKQAMHLGGSPFSDELHFMADRLRWKGHFSEINVLDNLWTSRVTSHIGLGQVSALITKEAVSKAITLIDGALRTSGVKEPRLAVAALNPHGGEGGLFGREEIDAIAPAIARARSEGINANGPFPADTIFLRARGGQCDAIVSMYHDQGQIAMKLMGFERGVTVQGGLPIPITTPSHGTAFDIAGQGKANPGAIWRAFQIACRMASHTRPAQKGRG